MSRRLLTHRVDLDVANAFVAREHSHHEPVQGHMFSFGCYDGARLCGVIIVGRPVAPALDDGMRLEATRCCTDRTLHAASMLYGRAAHAMCALGLRQILTYVLETEAATSLRAAGWMRLERDGAPVRCGKRQGALGWDSRSRTEPMALALALPPRHVGGFKHRWFKDNPEWITVAPHLAALSDAPEGGATNSSKETSR